MWVYWRWNGQSCLLDLKCEWWVDAEVIKWALNKGEKQVLLYVNFVLEAVEFSNQFKSPYLPLLFFWHCACCLIILILSLVHGKIHRIVTLKGLLWRWKQIMYVTCTTISTIILLLLLLLLLFLSLIYLIFLLENCTDVQSLGCELK